MSENACSPTDEEVKFIMVKGAPVGINHLKRTLDEVRELDLTNEAQIQDELMKRIKSCNYVPKSVIPDYREALLEEYNKPPEEENEDEEAEGS